MTKQTISATALKGKKSVAQTSKMGKRIAIQGVHGAFHEIAARHFHAENDLEIVPADTFDDVVSFTESGHTEGGMMAIENTIAGSLLRNYNLLNNSELEIKGEIFLRIKQNLMALPGVSIEQLKEVHSHPIALQQCEDFFKKYSHIRLVEAKDTALVAKEIQEKKLKKIGAIGSMLAAEVYRMNVLAESIETYKKNFTRFLSIGRKFTENNVNTEGVSLKSNFTNFDKISLVFTTNHTVGSLHKALDVLAINNCNLTKIQSAPIMDKPWEYLFFVDFTLGNYSNYTKAMSELSEVTGEIKILGEYQSGQYFE